MRKSFLASLIFLLSNIFLFSQKSLDSEISDTEKLERITIINAENKVDSILNYILLKNKELNNKIEERELHKQNEISNSLVERYLSGEKSLQPSILKIIVGDNMDMRHKLYKDLINTSQAINDQDLINAIYNNISKQEDESLVIIIAGDKKLNGYEKLLENKLHLISNKSNIHSILSYLSEDGSNVTALNFLKNEIIKKEVYDYQFDLFVDFLSNYIESNDKKIKEQVFEIMLIAFEKVTKSESDFNMYIGGYGPDHNSKFTNVLFSYHDERIIPVAKYYLKNDAYKHIALTALNNYKRKICNKEVIALIKDENYFYYTLDLAVYHYKATKDKKIIETVIEAFDKQPFLFEYENNYKFIDAILQMDAKYMDKLDLFMNNKWLVNSIKATYLEMNTPYEKIAKELYEFGIVNKPVSKEVIEYSKNINNFPSVDTKILNLLSSMGGCAYIDYDYEYFDYNEIISSYIACTNENLGEIYHWTDSNINDGYGNSIDKSYVFANNKIYITNLENTGLSCDYNSIFELLNIIAKDANINERFELFDIDYYLFLNHNNLDKLKNKYDFGRDAFLN